MEFFIAWYSANPYEGFAFVNRAFGTRVGVLDHDFVQRHHAAILLVQSVRNNTLRLVSRSRHVGMWSSAS